jgi:transposase
VSPSVRAALKQIVRCHSAAQRDVRRAAIVLLAARGWSNCTIALRLSIDVTTVRLWRERFAADSRVASLVDQPRSGRPSVVPTEVRCELLKLACDRPRAKDASSVWTIALLAKALAESTGWWLSKSEVGRILRNGQLRPHRMRLWLHSPDPDFRAKVKAICALYCQPPTEATVLCVDEKTQIQALERRFPGRAPIPGAEGRYEFEYRRRGTIALFAAFNTKTGHVVAECRKRRMAVDVTAFMDKVADTYPTGDVYIVWDNLDIHREGPPKRWTEFNRRHGNRFHFVYTPKHASWMNQVEIWFSILQRRVIRFGTFSSVADLTKKLGAFVRVWNRSPRPFRWTFRGDFAHDRRPDHAEAPRRAA